MDTILPETPAASLVLFAHIPPGKRASELQRTPDCSCSSQDEPGRLHLSNARPRLKTPCHADAQRDHCVRQVRRTDIQTGVT